MTIKIIILVAVLLILACILLIYHDMTHFVVRHYEISSNKIKKDITFCLLSDLHEKSYGEKNHLLAEAIIKENPDAILMAGDMITGQNSRHASNMEPVLSLLDVLTKKYPVYAANGNHEYRMSILGCKHEEVYKKYENELIRRGVVLLRNTGIYLEEYNMEIHGLELGYEHYRKVKKYPMVPGYIEGCLGEPCEQRYQLLIAHNPQYFEEYCKWGADLTVAGHVHGGIARLPLLGGVISPAVILFPKYDGGLFRNNGRYMVLSRGLGMHSIPIRFNNPGEVCVIKIKREG